MLPRKSCLLTFTYSGQCPQTTFAVSLLNLRIFTNELREQSYMIPNMPDTLIQLFNKIFFTSNDYKEGKLLLITDENYFYEQQAIKTVNQVFLLLSKAFST